MKTLMRLLILSISTSLLLTGCEQKLEQKTETVKPVKAFVVGSKENEEIRRFPGKVLATQYADLSFQESGKIITLNAVEGAEVNKGDLLSRLDPEQFQEAVDRSKAKYLLADSQFKRAKHLIKDGYISQSNYDRLDSNYQVAKANLQTDERKLKETYLYAPFAGTIAKRYVEMHEEVKAKQPIVKLHNINNIDVSINVPENFIINLEDPKRLKIHLVFESAPDKDYPVKLKEYSSEADPDTQTYQVIFTLPTPKNIQILPGMTTTIVSKLAVNQASATTFLVPSSAVFDHSDKQPSVWVIDPKTMRVSVKPVKLGKMKSHAVEVTSGLKRGDEIVSAGVHFLKEGQQVRILKQDVKS